MIGQEESLRQRISDITHAKFRAGAEDMITRLKDAQLLNKMSDNDLMKIFRGLDGEWSDDAVYGMACRYDWREASSVLPFEQVEPFLRLANPHLSELSIKTAYALYEGA